jgi:hypothetical protein
MGHDFGTLSSRSNVFEDSDDECEIHNIANAVAEFTVCLAGRAALVR